MVRVAHGTHCVEGFLGHWEMEKMEYPDEKTDSFLLEVGDRDYYLKHLKKLRHTMEDEYGYYFDVGKLADALYHLGKIDGFLNSDVLSEENDGMGKAIRIEYRTDEMYPLRVKVAETDIGDSWYTIAPCRDEGGSE